MYAKTMAAITNPLMAEEEATMAMREITSYLILNNGIKIIFINYHQINPTY